MSVSALDNSAIVIPFPPAHSVQRNSQSNGEKKTLSDILIYWHSEDALMESGLQCKYKCESTVEIQGE